MSGATGLCFRVADNEAKPPFLATASLWPIPSIWAIAPGARLPPADMLFFRKEMRAWLLVLQRNSLALRGWSPSAAIRGG
jgi:hypothetical protein